MDPMQMHFFRDEIEKQSGFYEAFALANKALGKTNQTLARGAKAELMPQIRHVQDKMRKAAPNSPEMRGYNDQLGKLTKRFRAAGRATRYTGPGLPPRPTSAQNAVQAAGTASGKTRVAAGVATEKATEGAQRAFSNPVVQGAWTGANNALVRGMNTTGSLSELGVNLGFGAGAGALKAVTKQRLGNAVDAAGEGLSVLL